METQVSYVTGKPTESCEMHAGNFSRVRSSASIPAHDHQIRNTASQVGRFSLHFLEMLLAMMAGMPIFSLVRSLIPASSSVAAAFKAGTISYSIAMTVFMTVPMVAWMIVRGHGWRHSLEMAFAMCAPVAAIIVLRLLGVDAPWLGNASHAGMFLGMLGIMLYRRAEYTTGHAAHHHAGSPQTETTEHATHVER